MDFWGKYRRGIETADAAYFATIAQYDDVQVLVAAQAASLYGSIRTTEPHRLVHTGRRWYLLGWDVDRQDWRTYRVDRLDPRTLKLEVVRIEGGVLPDDLVVWDETRPDPAIAFMLAQLEPPAFPAPIGVFRAVERPTYEERVIGQIQAQQDKMGTGTLEQLLYSGEVWKVGADGAIERQGMGSE